MPGAAIPVLDQHALDEAGIESPCPNQGLNLPVNDQTLAEVWQAWQGEGQPRTIEWRYAIPSPLAINPRSVSIALPYNSW